MVDVLKQVKCWKTLILISDANLFGISLIAIRETKRSTFKVLIHVIFGNSVEVDGYDAFVHLLPEVLCSYLLRILTLNGYTSIFILAVFLKKHFKPYSDSVVFCTVFCW